MKEINELDLPEDLRYTEDHEWAKPEGDAATIGVTDYAQEQLGDIVFVEPPQPGDKFQQGDEFGTVESVKAVAELYMPVAGEVIEVNHALEDAPERGHGDGSYGPERRGCVAPEPSQNLFHASRRGRSGVRPHMRGLAPDALSADSQDSGKGRRLSPERRIPHDRPCMHECVFSDKFQRRQKITTLDMAKRLMDFGFHPPTIYFPLVVEGAMMIEPTETETREEIDRFIEACRMVATEAAETPDLLRDAPKRCKVERLDETSAARRPCLMG